MERKYSELYRQWLWYIKEKKLYGKWIRDIASMINNNTFYGFYYDKLPSDDAPLIPNSGHMRAFDALLKRNTEDSFRYEMSVIKFRASMILGECNFNSFWPELCAQFFKERRNKRLSVSLSRKLTRKNTPKVPKDKTLADKEEKWYYRFEKKKNRMIYYHGFNY